MGLSKVTGGVNAESAIVEWRGNRQAANHCHATSKVLRRAKMVRRLITIVFLRAFGALSKSDSSEIS